MRISELLAEGYKETIAAFNQEAGNLRTNDATIVQQTIDQYKSLVNRNQLQGNERNIDWWRLSYERQYD